MHGSLNVKYHQLLQQALKEHPTQRNVALCSLYRCSWITKKYIDLNCTKWLYFHKPTTTRHAFKCMNTYFFQSVSKHVYTAAEKYKTDISKTKVVCRLQSAMTAQQRRVTSDGKRVCCWSAQWQHNRVG